MTVTPFETEEQAEFAGADQGTVAATIIWKLLNHVKAHRLGAVYSGGTAFRLAPDTVRVPSVAFVRSERVVKTPNYVEGAPDVVFEVISPTDRYSYVDGKRAEWLMAGTHAVVIVDPKRNSVTLNRPGTGVRVTDTLALDDILPGWRLPLAELFE